VRVVAVVVVVVVMDDAEARGVRKTVDLPAVEAETR
jgi:hypothetical protein